MKRIPMIDFINVESDWTLDLEEAESVLAESSACNALSFFGISYDEEGINLTRPIIQADFTTVQDYLQAVEAEIDHINPTAKAYDDWTKDHRGADDGTFDYAGTFVIEILDRIMQCQ